MEKSNCNGIFISTIADEVLLLLFISFFPSRNNPHIIWTIHFISHSPPSLMYENPPPLYVGRVLSAQALATIHKMKMIFIRRGENEKKNSSWKKKYILVVVVAVFFFVGFVVVSWNDKWWRERHRHEKKTKRGFSFLHL